MSEQSEKGLLAKQLEECRFNKCLLLLQCGKVGSSGVGGHRLDGHGLFFSVDMSFEEEAVCNLTCLPWAYFIVHVTPRLNECPRRISTP